MTTKNGKEKRFLFLQKEKNNGPCIIKRDIISLHHQRHNSRTMNMPWNKWLPEFTGIKDICNCSLHAYIYNINFRMGIIYLFCFFPQHTYYSNNVRVIFIILYKRLWTDRVVSRVRNRRQHFQEVEMSKYF